MSLDYKNCQTCSEQGFPVPIEGGTVYSYACTSEIVVFHDPKKPVRVIKACPDIGRVGREQRILARGEK